MSALSQKETRALLKSLEAQGARVTPTTKGYMIWFPDGSSTALHKSNSDWRSTLNARSEVKRAGLDWPFDHKPHKKKEPEMGLHNTKERRDELDAAILAWDGPISPAALGRAVGMSEPTVVAAMKKLGYVQRMKRGLWHAPEKAATFADAPRPGSTLAPEVDEAEYEEIERARAEAQAKRIDEMEKSLAEPEAKPERVVTSATKTWLTSQEKALLASTLANIGDGPTSPAKLSRLAGVSSNAASRFLLREGFTMKRRGTWTRDGRGPSITEVVEQFAQAQKAAQPTTTHEERIILDSAESWVVPVPRKLERMAEEMGLRIEVRVWREK